MMGNAQWKVPGLGSRRAGGRVVGGLTAALLGCALLQTAPALAQAEAEAEEAAGPPGADGMDGRSPEERELGDGTAPPSETEPGFKVTDPGDIKSEAEDSPIEKPGETYYFVGLRYRGIVVPKFMQNMFGADGGRTVYVDNIGPEVAIRKDNFEYIFSLTWADYSLEPTPFKGSSDEEDAWEIIESEINMIYLKADFMWTQPITPQFGFNFGMGAGFGLVFGDLYRTQAHRLPNGDYAKCVAPGNPNGFYCGNDNDHYPGYTEPSWTDGGSKPILFPWLALNLGLRYKFHRHFVARLDTGFGTSGFFFGLGADYGI